ncbi:MAG: Nramp family divalent metal transporter [Kiritimatiellales bacterium]|nr:Nramp family divalent metal transporter [Kiritimatiellota bacterium]MBL7012387.1 Nramp family divalent metal transporter [Kiritimatiellales bacterium]
MKNQNLLKSIGPGILLAGAAIGGSHLLASTTAGARYGFSLLWIVLLINLLKYPFFEYGQRYTAATGETILDGYMRLGRWELLIFFLLNLFTAIANIAGVSLIAGILAAELFGTAPHPFLWTGGILGICVTLMIAGKYKWLDRAMKIQISLLALATVIALAAAARYNHGFALAAAPPAVWNKTGLLFLIALMGWMPAPIELSAWTSLWMQERKKETGHAATVREARIDFHIGYFTTAALAVVFLSLGALVMFGSGETLQAGAGFAKQFIELYTRALGSWIRPVVALAAFITMFSTSLTCIDGYPRALAASLQRIVPAWQNRFKPLYFTVMSLTALLSLAVVGLFLQSLKVLLEVAMILSFLAAPVFAIINYRIVTAGFMPAGDRPGKAMRALSWAGILFLAGFSLLFIISRFTGS